MAVIQQCSPGHAHRSSAGVCLSLSALNVIFLSPQRRPHWHENGRAAIAEPSSPHHTTPLLTPPGYTQVKDTGYIWRK